MVDLMTNDYIIFKNIVARVGNIEVTNFVSDILNVNVGDELIIPERTFGRFKILTGTEFAFLINNTPLASVYYEFYFKTRQTLIWIETCTVAYDHVDVSPELSIDEKGVFLI